MSNLFMLLSLLSLVGLILGLITPRLVIRWGSRRTRGRVILTYGLAVVVFFILFGITAPAEKVVEPNIETLPEVAEPVEPVAEPPVEEQLKEVPAVVVPEPEPVDTATMGEKNALKKAIAYLDLSAFSRSGLIAQLEFEGFTNAQAEFGAKAVGY